MKRLSLVLLTVLACKTSASYSSQSGSGTTSPDNHGKPAQYPDAGKPGDPAVAGGGGAATPGGAPAPCVTAMNGESTSVFAGRVIIRLPKGLELVEQNSFLAVAASPQTATSCGGVIRYAAVGFFQYPGSAELTSVRDHLMGLRGIPTDTIAWSEEGSRGRNYTAVYSAPADSKTGAPETKGWLVMRDAPNDKYLYFAMFESEPAAFDGLKAAFQESGRRLLVKPGALQAGDVIEAGPNDKPKPKPITSKKAG